MSLDIDVISARMKRKGGINTAARRAQAANGPVKLPGVPCVKSRPHPQNKTELQLIDDNNNDVTNEYCTPAITLPSVADMNPASQLLDTFMTKPLQYQPVQETTVLAKVPSAEILLNIEQAKQIPTVTTVPQGVPTKVSIGVPAGTPSEYQQINI
ncbi:hypothetical protein QTN25_010287 [Entamoeba marina]